MDADGWAKLRGLIEGALDVPAPERREYLESACGGDGDLLREAAALLRFGDEAAADGLGIGLESVSCEERGAEAWDAFLEQIGARGKGHERYEPLGEIGRGGMGVVRKVLDKDLRRTLAMKVIRPEKAAPGSRSALDSVSLGRFLEEAQVTSQLDHPGIVPVHELGLDADGNAYFTMKMVKGIELGEVFEHVREGRDGWTSTRALNAILRACEAVAYAHAKGVIHRDLKPSNIMVGRYGETYVMDWGLARVMGTGDPTARGRRRDATASVTIIGSDRADLKDQETDSSLGTMDGDVVGTPVYMAPEQASGHQVEVGPTVDVYAMGAILYQLLTGRMPYVPPDTRPSPHTVLRWVMEGPPTPIAKLNRAVPPELAAICEKAMSRDPWARYRSMGELADDLRAYVERRVVKAYATGPSAELRKWVARNRGAALATVFGVLVVVGAGFLTAWQQRSHAAIVARERDAARAVADFQREVLTIDPWELGPDATPLDVVDRAAARARVAFDGQDEIEATILLAVGETYSSFGAFRQAAEQYEATLALRLGVLPEASPPVAEARRALAKAYLELGRLSDAAALHREILAARRARLGEAHSETLASKLDVAEVERELFRYDEAAALQREVVEARTAALGAAHVDTLEARQELADTLAALKRYDEADRIYTDVLATDGVPEKVALECRSGRASLLSSLKRREEAVAIEREVFKTYRDRLGDLHPDTLHSRDRLAGLLFALRRYEEVLEMDRQILDRRRQVLGETHPDTLTSMANEAYDLVLLERTEEGVGRAREAVERCSEAHGVGHPTTMDVTLLLARVLRAAGSNDEAVSIVRRLADLHREGLGEDHPETIKLRGELAGHLHRKGEYEESAGLWRDVVAARRAELGPAHPESVSAVRSLANALAGLGRHEEVLPLDQEVLERMVATYGDEHPETMSARESLALTERNLGRHASAERRLRRVVAFHRERDGETAEATLDAGRQLAKTLSAAERHDDAAAVWREQILALEESSGEDSEATLAAVSELAGALAALGRDEEVESLDRRVLEGRRRTLGEEHEETIEAKRILSVTLHRIGRTEEAVGLLRDVIEIAPPEVAADAERSLLTMLESLRRYDEAISLWRGRVARLGVEEGAGDAATLRATSELASALIEVGAWEEAARYDGAVLDAMLADDGTEPEERAQARRYLASTLRRCDAFDEAEEQLHAALAEAAAALGEDHAERWHAEVELGLLRQSQGRLDEAEAALRAVLDAVASAADGDALRLVAERATAGLGDVLVETDRAAEAEPLLAAAVDAAGDDPGSTILLRHGEALAALGRRDEAEARFQKALEGLSASRLRTRRTLWKRLAALYDAWERPEDAERMRGFLAESGGVVGVDGDDGGE